MDLVDGAIGMIAVVALLAAVAWALRPLLVRCDAAAVPDAEVASLLVRREATVSQLRDLDADYAGGRVGEADHRAARAAIVSEGAAVLERLERIEQAADRATVATARRIESDVAARGAGRVPDAARGADALTRCAVCGTEVAGADCFCRVCGAALRGGMEAS